MQLSSTAPAWQGQGPELYSWYQKSKKRKKQKPSRGSSGTGTSRPTIPCSCRFCTGTQAQEGATEGKRHSGLPGKVKHKGVMALRGTGPEDPPRPMGSERSVRTRLNRVGWEGEGAAAPALAPEDLTAQCNAPTAVLRRGRGQT